MKRFLFEIVMEGLKLGIKIADKSLEKAQRDEMKKRI